MKSAGSATGSASSSEALAWTYREAHRVVAKGESRSGVLMDIGCICRNSECSYFRAALDEIGHRRTTRGRHLAGRQGHCARNYRERASADPLLVNRCRSGTVIASEVLVGRKLRIGQRGSRCKVCPQMDRAQQAIQ